MREKENVSEQRETARHEEKLRDFQAVAGPTCFDISSVNPFILVWVATKSFSQTSGFCRPYKCRGMYLTSSLRRNPAVCFSGLWSPYSICCGDELSAAVGR